MPRKLIILAQLGSPKSPQVRDVRNFLKEFLFDPRVVDLPRLFWALIMYLFVLPFRPQKSARAYQRIWDGSGFPLVKKTLSLVEKMNSFSTEHTFKAAFLLSEPRLKDVLVEDGQVENQIYVIPQFPQYSESTTASVIDQIHHTYKTQTSIPSISWCTNFHLSKVFIDGLCTKIKNTLVDKNLLSKFIQGKLPLVFSFHGLPLRRVVINKDPYYRHCVETSEALILRLTQMLGVEVRQHTHVSFQSRFGSEQWLGPATDEYCLQLVQKKDCKEILVCAPSFMVDCLETTDELGHELANEITAAGGKLHLVDSLNDDEDWAHSYAQFLINWTNSGLSYAEEWFYNPMILKAENIMPEQKLKSPPLTKEAKAAIKVVFVTLFLDLIGFSIIFPLFPALAKHYLEVDSQNVFLRAIFDSITTLFPAQTSSNSVISPIVLFGGALGAIYSFLQFLAAPFWGALSDKIGRKPILMISIFGLMVSYILWFFSGSFTLLIFARFLGGIMAGNISTATAVVADVTSVENRAKGMAFIGIAFALGFVLGPAIGGISSMWDLTSYFDAAWGVNPFSAAALVAATLSFFNLLFLTFKFKETLPIEKRGKGVNERSINPLVLFRPLPYKGVNLANYGHFLFLMAFSGMEFTLTFLMFDRFQYTSMQNAYLFVFIGFILILVQGGVVRRSAHQVGEKKMALMGLVSLLPGLILIGVAQQVWAIYLGLFFLAVGSAMAIPCLTTLTSSYTPAEHQGRSLGVFRSLGALGRVLGPLLASILYWRWGGQAPYFVGTAFLIIPILMVGALPGIKGKS